MRKIILLFFTLMIGFTIQSQEVKKKKNARISFEVDGICGMCKKRIETASLKTKGVKFAIWNVKTHQLNLIMDERKTTVDKIYNNITAVGHDVILSVNDTLKAKKEDYDSIHPCCKYRDDEIVLDHEEGVIKKKQ